MATRRRTPDKSAARMARLKQRRLEQGLVHRAAWLTPEQAAAFDRILAGECVSVDAPASVQADAEQRQSDAPAADDGDLLSQAAAAAVLGVSVRMMQQWRKTGTGPVFETYGRTAMYRRAAVDAFLATGWTKQAGGRRRKQP